MKGKSVYFLTVPFIKIINAPAFNLSSSYCLYRDKRIAYVTQRCLAGSEVWLKECDSLTYYNRSLTTRFFARLPHHTILHLQSAWNRCLLLELLRGCIRVFSCTICLRWRETIHFKLVLHQKQLGPEALLQHLLLPESSDTGQKTCCVMESF